MPPSHSRSVTPSQLIAICGLLLTSAAIVARSEYEPLLVGLCIVSTALIVPAGRLAAVGERPAAALGFSAVSLLSVAAVIGLTGQFGSVVSSACLAVTVLASCSSLLPAANVARSETQPPEASAQEVGSKNSDVDRDLERRLLTRVAGGEAPLEEELDTENETGQREVLLRVERGVHADGTEWIEGTLQATFESGQRQAALHVPFWPALGATPDVDCEVVSTGDVRVRAACRQRWGLRFDLSRHSNASAEETVEIAFYARSAQVRREAA